MSAPDGRARSAVDRPWALIEVVGHPAAIEAEWDELADRTGAEPYARAGWIAAWWDAFGDEGRLGVVALRRGGRLSAVAPLVRRAGFTESPVNEHTPRFALLAEDDAAARDLASVLVRLRQKRLTLRLVEAGDPVAEAVRDAAEAAGYHVLQVGSMRSPWLALQGVAEADAALDRKMRKELRRCRRRLDDLGAVEIGVEPPDGDLEALLGEAFAVEAMGWKGEAGSAIAASPEARAFYTAVARWAAARGTLRLVTARLDGRMVAFELDILQAGRMHALKTGFDPELARLSPGHLVALAAVQHAIDAGASSYEMLGDDEPYKLRWTDSTRELTTLEASAPGARGMADDLARRYVRRGAWAVKRHGGSILRRFGRSG